MLPFRFTCQRVFSGCQQMPTWRQQGGRKPAGLAKWLQARTDALGHIFPFLQATPCILMTRGDHVLWICCWSRGLQIGSSASHACVRTPQNKQAMWIQATLLRLSVLLSTIEKYSSKVKRLHKPLMLQEKASCKYFTGGLVKASLKIVHQIPEWLKSSCRLSNSHRPPLQN